MTTCKEDSRPITLSPNLPLVKPALIVFGKVPRPGHVKRRLTQLLSPEDAAALYEAFLRDALDAYVEADSETSVRLYLDGVPPEGLVPSGISVHRQTGTGLGERMGNAFAEAFRDGCERCVIVGTDHPTLPMAYVRSAFDMLHTPMTAVIGPARDGGYYLLGLNELSSWIFDMEYSHDEVFSETLERLQECDLTPVVLPEHDDVDTPAHLKRLVSAWENGELVGRRTANVLDSLIKRYNVLA